MKLTLHFDIETDEEGWQHYLAEYPDFKDESSAETLLREAIAAWDFEGLIKSVEAVSPVEVVS